LPIKRISEALKIHPAKVYLANHRVTKLVKKRSKCAKEKTYLIKRETMSRLTITKLVLFRLRELCGFQKLHVPKILDGQDMLRVRRSILRKLSRRRREDGCQLA